MPISNVSTTTSRVQNYVFSSATLDSQTQQKYKNNPQIQSDDAVNLTCELYDPNAQVNHLHKRRKKKT